MRSLLEQEDIRRDYEATLVSHKMTARDVREWVLGKPGESDFDSNTKLLLAQDYLQLKPRHLALAAATVAMFRKSTAEAKQAAVPSAHVGKVGEKRWAAVTVERVVELDNAYSRASMFLVVMKDRSGNKLAWRSAAVPREVVHGEGKSFEVSFKVKGHGDYKGVSQTDVSHLKVISSTAGEQG